MTLERRLTRLEGTLSPKAATLLWLAEAHAFESMHAYVAWLVDQPASAAPLYRVPAAARAGVRATMRGQPHPALERAVREAVRHAVFLVELVIRLNAAAELAIGHLGLRCVALYWEGRAIDAEARLEGMDESRRDQTGTLEEAWRMALSDLARDPYLAEEVRSNLERRYLDAVPVLFPDGAADWQSLRAAAERLAGVGNSPGAAPSAKAGRPRRSSKSAGIDLADLNAAAQERAPFEAARLLDAARGAALDALGDIDGAAHIAERAVRASVDGAGPSAPLARRTVRRRSTEDERE